MASIAIEPSEIVFDLANKEPVAVLTLKNLSKLKVAYKVKTTMPRRYLVRPNQEILGVGGSMKVTISLQAKDATAIKQMLQEDPESEHDMKDKFLIQSIEMVDKYQKMVANFANDANHNTNGEENHAMADVLSPIWKNAGADEVSSQKFKCQFKFPAAVGGTEIARMDDVDDEQLRKNYQNLLKEMVKITNERDFYRTSFMDAEKEVDRLKRQGMPQTQELVKSTKSGFSWFQIIAVSILAFALAFFIQTQLKFDIKDLENLFKQ